MGDQEQGKRTGQTEDEQSAERDNGHVSPWEWLVAAVGLVLVTGTIGFMLYHALAGGDTPPRIEVAVASIEQAGSGFLVTFTATNQGDMTAADVIVEGELRDDSGSKETSSAMISYVPAGSSREGGLYFAQDPRQFQLELHAKGFERP
jgi:uncharacterized protein (TIGR02588 family)